MYKTVSAATDGLVAVVGRNAEFVQFLQKFMGRIFQLFVVQFKKSCTKIFLQML
jgi:hypothetical protein